MTHDELVTEVENLKTEIAGLSELNDKLATLAIDTRKDLNMLMAHVAGRRAGEDAVMHAIMAPVLTADEPAQILFDGMLTSLHKSTRDILSEDYWGELDATVEKARSVAKIYSR